jgi:hypothetical protein
MKNKVLIGNLLLFFFSLSLVVNTGNIAFCLENNCIRKAEKACDDCCSDKADLPFSKHKECSLCIEKTIFINEQSEKLSSKVEKVFPAQYKLLYYEYFDFDIKSREDFYSRSSILLNSTLYAIRTIVLIA